MASPLRVLLLLTGLLSISRMGTRTLGSTSCLVVVEGFAVPQSPPRTTNLNRIPAVAAAVATAGTRSRSTTQRTSSLAVYLTAATTVRGGGDGGEGTEEDVAAMAVESTPRRVVDTTAIIKYLTAITIQMSCFLTFFTGLDLVLATGHISQHQIPFIQVWNFLLFYAFSLKSRIFNPMSNARPRGDTKELANSATTRTMPTWTPPGFVFPIMWILIISPLRALSSTMLVATVGKYTSAPLLALMFHLSIGDTWNTINNVERRYGTSVLGVGCVWCSAAYAARAYRAINPVAGMILALPLLWLSIASSLIVRTWQLNPTNPVTGTKASFLPTKPADTAVPTITKLAWFE